MAKKVEIEVDVKGNVVESTKNMKALKQQLKEVPAGTAEWSKIKNQIRDIEDALESANASSEDFKGQLENAPGPLGALGGAIKKVELATKSWGAAFKALGIGLLVFLKHYSLL
jgi:chromosome segregation ATPase